jgi:hypothetical protein
VVGCIRDHGVSECRLLIDGRFPAGGGFLDFFYCAIKNNGLMRYSRLSTSLHGVTSAKLLFILYIVVRQ